jgi:hypothetical protein
MAGKNGGARKGAGRPKGAKTQITEEAIKRAGDGETPLEYMLRVMRDHSEDIDRRDKMAIGAAPYVHARKTEVDAKVTGNVTISTGVPRD